MDAVSSRCKRNVGPLIDEHLRSSGPRQLDRPPRQVQKIPRRQILLADLDSLNAFIDRRRNASKQRLHAAQRLPVRDVVTQHGLQRLVVALAGARATQASAVAKHLALEADALAAV